MKVSLNTVKQYTTVDLPIDELVTRINEQLGGVEEIIDIAEKYRGITIVRVVECGPLEGTDHLNVTKVDDGGVVEGVERDANGLVQVVCGAPNVRAGMLAVWLAPGVTVPESYDEAEPFVLGAKPLRSVMSNGMLASPKELSFGDSHEGILEIDPNEWKPGGIEIKEGTDFAQAYGLNDTVIDIENKMFTHRPDCFGQLGVAREIAGILGKKFVSPNWYKDTVEFGGGEGLNLEVQNDAPDKVSRFMAVAIKDVTVKPSPVWLQAELVRLGAKPINNIVDVTNYVMLLTAQPMHAYDYDKVGSKLGVRMAHDGELIALLNGKNAELNSSDIVITDGEKAIGIGGVMGGSETEVSDDTKNIILECANFDMYTLRRTSMRHGLFTDAVTRFTKGQSPLQNPAVLQLAMKSVYDVAGGQQASDVVDVNHVDGSRDMRSIEVAFINKRLGLALSSSEVASLLGNVEFTIDASAEDRLSYDVPFWRTDIEISEDVVEEVGRLFGFDKLPQELPRRTLTPAPVSPRQVLKAKLRDTLSRAGANEVLTYSFIHKNLLEKAGQDIEDTYKLSNALSPDLQYLRRTVLPSLLDKVNMNVRAGYDKFAIFEIGKGHKKSAGRDDQGVPVEQQYVAMVLAGGDFYQAKAFTEFIAKSLAVQFEYVSVKQSEIFEPKRSAHIYVGEKVVGVIGEYRALIKKNFKLPDVASGVEIDFDGLLNATKNAKESYRPLSKFPSAERDVTLQVSRDSSFTDVEGAVIESLSSTGLDVLVSPLGIYQPDEGDTKNVTLRLKLTSYEKTMTGDEVAVIMRALEQHVSSKINASII
ncbi:MAG: phenylalanine--tRNA ligase subunit beta [Candidatus Nomurabacteria bacterium]|nr:MAG: phenylalanine--tRNA ligase subunit beta [Candidatus Nomurabacteria bacterium]